MHVSNSELPPADFVAFMAERAGLSKEAAEHRLERWFGEYQASVGERAPFARRPGIKR